jgi:hypothetical protein
VQTQAVEPLILALKAGKRITTIKLGRFAENYVADVTRL